MKLAHLVSIRRYRRCRRIFQYPMAAHLRLARGASEPAELPLRSGEALRVPNVRQCRRLFDWLLHDSLDALPIAAEDGILVFQHQDRRIALRPIDTDFYTFGELFLRDTYGLNGQTGALGDVVDIGANIGLFTVRVAPLARRVIAVEPVQANLDIARRNVALAGLDAKVTFYRRAVAAESDGTLKLFVSARNHGGHSICQEHAAQWGPVVAEEVPTISLADLFERERIEQCSLLKCDVEGAEFNIFASAPREILARIDRIAMEVHLTAPAWKDQEFRKLCEKLRDCGFLIEHEPLSQEPGEQKRVLTLFATKGSPAKRGALCAPVSCSLLLMRPVADPGQPAATVR